MNVINSFFSIILSMQFLLEKIEKWYLKKRQYLPWIVISNFIIVVISVVCKQVLLGVIFLILDMLLIGFDNIVGWKNSVKKWLKICVIYNLFFSIILACVMQEIITSTIMTPLFIMIYMAVWLFLSLISYSEVSLLVNEIVSGITATVFTIGTYITSILLKNMPSSNDYLLYFQSDEIFERALENGNPHAWNFLGAGLLERLESAFLSLLPIIGVTALCIIMVKMKKYWMEKNKISEPEAKRMKMLDKK